MENLRNPLSTSPSASANVFPCSFVMSLASSLWNGERERIFTSVYGFIFMSYKLLVIISTQTQKIFINTHTHTYNIVLNQLLVLEHDLLPCENGRLGPIWESKSGGIHSFLHLNLCRLGYTYHYLVERRGVSGWVRVTEWEREEGEWEVDWEREKMEKILRALSTERVEKERENNIRYHLYNTVYTYSLIRVTLKHVISGLNYLSTFNHFISGLNQLVSGLNYLASVTLLAALIIS